MINHPYINYALALLMNKRNIVNVEDINHEDLLYMIDICLEHVSLKWESFADGMVHFCYSSNFIGYGNTMHFKKGAWLQAPHVISEDIPDKKKDKGFAIEKTIKTLKTDLLKNRPLKNKGSIQKSILPIGGEYLRFSEKSVNKACVSLSLLEKTLIAITTLTEEKPCMAIIKKEVKGVSYNNICIIPDLSIPVMMDFIDVFNLIKSTGTSDLFWSRIYNNKKGKKEAYCLPPQIYYGNFPNAVRTPYLSALSILGSVGYLLKKKDVNKKIANVLNELEHRPIYIFFQSGNAETFVYNHYIIELAKEGNLKSIIDSLYEIKLYKKPERDNDDTDYQRLEECISRFLILFNKTAFNNFLSCRAQYPDKINDLFTKYFCMMNGIDKEVIESAKIIGGWINNVAFKVAKEEIDKDKEWKQLTPKERNDIVERKYKILIELENCIFSAKDGDSMIRQLFTRIGRAANEDAPEQATIFMDAVFEDRISLTVAKNMLIAYSRVRTNKDDASKTEGVQLPSEKETDEDNSNI